MIASGIAFDQYNLAVIFVDSIDIASIDTLNQLNALVGFQVEAYGDAFWFLMGCGSEIDNVLLGERPPHEESVVLEQLSKGWFGVAAINRNEHGLVIFVSILIQHE